MQRTALYAAIAIALLAPGLAQAATVVFEREGSILVGTVFATQAFVPGVRASVLGYDGLYYHTFALPGDFTGLSWTTESTSSVPTPLWGGGKVWVEFLGPCGCPMDLPHNFPSGTVPAGAAAVRVSPASGLADTTYVFRVLSG